MPKMWVPDSASLSKRPVRRRPGFSRPKASLTSTEASGNTEVIDTGGTDSEDKALALSPPIWSYATLRHLPREGGDRGCRQISAQAAACSAISSIELDS